MQNKYTRDNFGAKMKINKRGIGGGGVDCFAALLE